MEESHAAHNCLVLLKSKYCGGKGMHMSRTSASWLLVNAEISKGQCLYNSLGPQSQKCWSPAAPINFS